jgi:DNA-binding response OmpR family regulator
MKKILIVEDELLIAGNLERILEKHGYSVPTIAIDYEQAISAL